MKLRTQIAAIVLVPVLGIFAVSGMGLKQSLRNLHEVELARSSVELTVPLTSLIHNLQIERGMSAGYIASSGKNFANDLPAQRKTVDEAIAKYAAERDALAASDLGTTRELDAGLQDLSAMRDRISRLDLDGPEMAAFYTGTIQHALELNAHMYSRFGELELARAGAGLVALSEAKEAAGLERAMGATGFSAGSFAPSVLQRFAHFGSLQETELDQSELFAEVMGEGMNYQAGPEYDEVVRLRGIVLGSDGQDLQGESGPNWFAASTKWIEKLRADEQAFNAATLAMAESKAANARQNAMAYGGATLLALLASLIGGFLTSRSFGRKVGRLSRAMDAIAGKDFEVEIAGLSEKSEIGDLSRSLDSMRNDLKDANVRLRAAFAKSFAYEGSASAMMIVNSDMQIVTMNDASREMMNEKAPDLRAIFDGFDPATLVGTSIDRFHADPSHQRRILADPSRLPWHTDITIGDMKFELNASYIEAEDGSYAGNVLEWRDVTSARLQSGMIAAIERDQGVVEYTIDGKIVRANENFAKALGVPAADLVGKTQGDILHPDEPRRADQSKIWTSLAAGKSEIARLRYAGAGGRSVWIRAAFNPVLDGNGKAFKVVLFAEDITHGVENHARQEAAKAEADAAREIVVQSLAQGLNRMSSGDLSHGIETSFAEEYESLRMDFNNAVDRLSDVLGNVSDNVGRLKGSAGELQSSATNLAKRTEAQAATLEETAAALDEVTATVKTTATGAQEADAAVRAAREGAESGSETVSQAIQAMDQIAESSEKISSIIKVIDDISFQTNLLALNAGVEAARAGDAGRGFAVVASEVRALAQRAAEAAREINALISTSRDQVQQGVQFVGGAGKVLEEISERVVSASDRVQDIRRATSEQANALQEINAAVNSMDSATQQNAAMVEEASALSVTLNGDADALADLVAGFALGSEEPAPRKSGGMRERVA